MMTTERNSTAQYRGNSEDRSINNFHHNIIGNRFCDSRIMMIL